MQQSTLQQRQDPTGELKNNQRTTFSTPSINYLQRYIVYLIVLLFGFSICTYLAYFTIQKESSNNIIVLKNNHNNNIRIKEEAVVVIGSSESKYKGTTNGNAPLMEEVGLDFQQQEDEEEANKNDSTPGVSTTSPPNQIKKGNNNNKRNNNNNNNNNINKGNKNTNNKAQQEAEFDLEIEWEEKKESETTATDAKSPSSPVIESKEEEEEVKEEVVEQQQPQQQETKSSSSSAAVPVAGGNGNGDGGKKKGSTIKTTFQSEVFCNNILSERPSPPIDYHDPQFECGRKRLLDEYGISISLNSIEVNPNTGVGNIQISMCQPTCFNKFNASDILLWVRFKSPEALFAIYPQPVDCRSWSGEFHLPVIETSAPYQVDVMMKWLHGHPKSWTSSSLKTYQKNTAWVGTKYEVKGFRIHWASINTARWMGCEDFCSEFSQCSHWTDTKNGPYAPSPGRCLMFSNVTGTKTMEGKGVVSGDYPSTEHRTNYLGGLAKWSKNMDVRLACRELAHVLGSPITLEATTKEKGNNNNNGNKKNLSSLSKLPWCTADDIDGRVARNDEEHGFWALASAVYPKMKNDNCPDACDSPLHLAKEKGEIRCTKEDMLEGICAFNDVSAGDGAIAHPEPAVKELAWVERDCRYHVGDGEMFQQCIREKKFDLLYLLADSQPFYYELFARWNFGRSNNMLKGSNVKGLREYWQNRTHKNEGKPLKAVVVSHLWPKMKDILYMGHKFEAESFVRPVNKQIKDWKDAMEYGWLSKDSVLIISLASSIHTQEAAPHNTHEAAEYYNEIARKLYGDAGWYILDTMAISRARPEHRMVGEWYGGGSTQKDPTCEKHKCAGSAVLFAMINVVYNMVCN